MRYKTLILLTFCAVITVGVSGPSTNVAALAGSLDAEFGTAAEKYEVPKELLLAMGYVNTRWEMPPPEASDYKEGERGEGSPEAWGSYGIMQLVQNPSKDTLGGASALIGVSREQLKTDREQNISGGAALLAKMQGDTKPKNLNEWYDVVSVNHFGSEM